MLEKFMHPSLELIGHLDSLFRIYRARNTKHLKTWLSSPESNEKTFSSSSYEVDCTMDLIDKSIGKPWQHLLLALVMLDGNLGKLSTNLDELTTEQVGVLLNMPCLPC